MLFQIYYKKASPLYREKARVTTSAENQIVLLPNDAFTFNSPTISGVASLYGNMTIFSLTSAAPEMATDCVPYFHQRARIFNLNFTDGQTGNSSKKRLENRKTDRKT